MKLKEVFSLLDSVGIKYDPIKYSGGIKLDGWRFRVLNYGRYAYIHCGREKDFDRWANSLELEIEKMPKSKYFNLADFLSWYEKYAKFDKGTWHQRHDPKFRLEMDFETLSRIYINRKRKIHIRPEEEIFVQ